ncbi:MAG: Tetratricopeptide repeat protein [Candidatus Angelobacter sp.]|jgi:tetratricopeptide (TPR) repeat protein|nr:Tetratricopeptide repeat protein [Candidatus Angelobacter sp.]
MIIFRTALLALASSLALPAIAQTQTPASPAGPQAQPQQQQRQAAPQSTVHDSNGNSQAKSALAVNQKKPRDRAAAYYHYALAHSYEELVALYGRSEYANKAIEEYKLAIENDPDSEFLNSGLAELYAKTSRIKDAVIEAQSIIQRDPKNVDARKLLGRIYLRSLGDLQSGTQSQEVLKLAIEQFEQIVQLEPKAIDNHLLLGRLYILNKDLLKAENEFKTAVKLQPDSEEAVTNLAYLYNEEGDQVKATQTLSSIPEPGRTAKLYSALGYTYEQQKDYKKAIDAYRKAIEQDKENLDAMRGLAQNLLSDGQLEASIEEYKLIVEADPQDAQAQLRIAEIQRRSGKLDAALESLKKAESLVQDSMEVPYNFALVYAAQGRYDDAILTLQKLLDKTAKPDGHYDQSESNNRAVFLERLGNIYREVGKTQPALDTFRKSLTLGDENAIRGYQQIIDTLRDAKQWSQATAVAQEAVAKYPKDRGLKLTLAGQLVDTGQVDNGLAQARSMLTGKNNKDDREVYLGISQIYSRLRRWKEAEEAAVQAEKLSSTPDEKEYVAYVQGSLFERQKKYDLAEEQFKRVLANDPQNAGTLNYLGYMLADRGLRLDEAVGYLKRALEIEPQNAAFLDSIGWAYFKQGNYELAEENLRKAVNKTSNDATLHEHLGDLYQKTGRLKLAADHWARALEEWNKSVPTEVDSNDVAKVQKKLEGARVKLAQQQK